MRDEVAGRLARPDVVLEVGSGTGLLTRTLSAAPCVVCVDMSLGMMHRAAIGSGVHGICGDAQRLPIADDVADVVVATNLIHLLPDPATAVSEMLRTVKQGGSVILTWPDPAIRVSAVWRYLRARDGLAGAARFIAGHVALSGIRLLARAPRLVPVPPEVESGSQPIAGGLQRLAVLTRSAA
ncbi:MAG: class I SAM-dependent methyltransferase [Candidatus Nanopelagicales bacterium]